MDVSHQQQTTMLRVLLVLSRCIHLSWHSSSSIAWRNGYQNWSLCRHLYSKEMCSDYWVASNIVDSHMTLVAVVKDTVSMVLEISYLQVVSLSVDLQSNVFIGAMADLIPQVLVWIPWTFSWQVNILAIVGSYDLHATVWSALSWPYQLHLMIAALAVGS
ncbi:hypothetical protein O0I10_013081 [Lichtheimia ornata]|uniref:Uncharacterized protein n=1 Tax=Lichtheimia ornata TaxID=688661 RepID=A0AAD7UPX6_9FUNG|nr:uncharacterized protein O0I10_013081 [Lichtheimia ornata]KAJ8651387.1 hypothetical protein O0I10_013081 [Lichtheimia ornata]